MYARVLRKWSPNAKLTSFMWLAVVTSIMLLLFVCAPAAAAAAAAALSTPASADYLNRLRPARAALTAGQTAAAAAATTLSVAGSGSMSSNSPYTIPTAEAETAAHANVGAAEESFYIPVASQADSNSANVASNIYTKRLITALSSSSSGSRSSSSSSSSISSIGSSKLSSSSSSSFSSNTYQQHVPVGAAATDAHNLAYAFYYAAPQAAAAATPAATAAVFDNLKSHRQQQLVVSNMHDYNQPQEDDADEEEEDEAEDDESEVDVDMDADVDVEAEEFEPENEQHAQMLLPSGAAVPNRAAVAPAAAPANKQKVPNLHNSQIINLFSSNPYRRSLNQQQFWQQQQQQPVLNSNLRSTKARRHAQEPRYTQLQQQQQLQLEQQQQQQQHQQEQQYQLLLQQQLHQLQLQQQLWLEQQVAAASQSYHSPVRETRVVRSKVELAAPTPRAAAAATPAVAAHSNDNMTGMPRFRYFIEAFEVPATLPFTGELTEQQREMLLHQQHLRRLQQQQAARNRRDSRAFGLKQNAGSGMGGYPQQQQQSQTFQRLQQQQQHQNLNSNIFHRQHQQQPQQQQQHRPLQRPYQHQHQHHPHQHHQRQTRRHPRRYCSARDPAQLAFEAPTVIEGKITSMSSDRRANFSVTFHVNHTFKQQFDYRLPDFVRLQFAYHNSSGECDIYREQLKPRGLVRGDVLEQGRVYLVFLQQVDVSNFTILGQPIRKTRRAVEAVQEAVSENYAQLASIRSITASNTTVESGRELRIICRVQGKPPPKVTWFKDHKSINRNRKLYQFRHYKKRSELIIRSFNSSDAGHYECRAKNKINSKLERRAIMITASIAPRFDTQSTSVLGNNCPQHLSEFCLNGGTCMFFAKISSSLCICPEGFYGERCDRKEVNDMPPSTYSNEQECGDKKYLGSYYC